MVSDSYFPHAECGNSANQHFPLTFDGWMMLLPIRDFGNMGLQQQAHAFPTRGQRTTKAARGEQIWSGNSK